VLLTDDNFAAVLEPDGFEAAPDLMRGAMHAFVELLGGSRKSGKLVLVERGGVLAWGGMRAEFVHRWTGLGTRPPRWRGTGQMQRGGWGVPMFALFAGGTLFRGEMDGIHPFSGSQPKALEMDGHAGAAVTSASELVFLAGEEVPGQSTPKNPVFRQLVKRVAPRPPYAGTKIPLPDDKDAWIKSIRTGARGTIFLTGTIGEGEATAPYLLRLVDKDLRRLDAPPGKEIVAVTADGAGAVWVAMDGPAELFVREGDSWKPATLDGVPHEQEKRLLDLHLDTTDKLLVSVLSGQQSLILSPERRPKVLGPSVLDSPRVAPPVPTDDLAGCRSRFVQLAESEGMVSSEGLDRARRASAAAARATGITPVALLRTDPAQVKYLGAFVVDEIEERAFLGVPVKPPPRVRCFQPNDEGLIHD
jgi:hypothetical protein